MQTSVVPLMRTPIALLAGLLALTVPLQPAEACSSADPNGCVDNVVAVVENACGGSVNTCDDTVLEPLCDGQPVASCLYEALCDGPNVNYCTETVLERLQPVIDRVEDLCGGSATTCDDVVVDEVEEFCGGPVATHCDDAAREAAEDAEQAARDAAGDVQRVVDADLDGVPDALEGEVCGRPALRDAINGSAPYLGACPTTADYTPPSSMTYVGIVLALAGYVLAEADQAIAYVMAEANEALETAGETAGWAADYALDAAGDHDRDGIPDDREPLVCGLENQNSDLDGSCVGGDYSSAAIPL